MRRCCYLRQEFEFFHRMYNVISLPHRSGKRHLQKIKKTAVYRSHFFFRSICNRSICNRYTYVLLIYHLSDYDILLCRSSCELVRLIYYYYYVYLGIWGIRDLFSTYCRVYTSTSTWHKTCRRRYNVVKNRIINEFLQPFVLISLYFVIVGFYATHELFNKYK